MPGLAYSLDIERDNALMYVFPPPPDQILHVGLLFATPYSSMRASKLWDQYQQHTCLLGKRIALTDLQNQCRLFATLDLGARSWELQSKTTRVMRVQLAT